MSGVTSVTTLLLFVGIMFGASMVIPALFEYSDRSAESQRAILDSIQEAKNTNFNVTSTNYNSSTDRVTITLKNTGSSTIRVSDIDLLVDGEYESFTVSVDGDSDRTVVNPTEKATLTVSNQVAPSRAKVTTSIGLSRFVVF